MSCDDPHRWQTAIIDRLADELSEEETVVLEQHLADCPDCRREARFLTEMMRDAALTEEWSPRPAQETRLIGALRSTAAAPGATNPANRPRAIAAPASLGWWRHPLPAYTAAVLAIAAGAAGFWTGSGRELHGAETATTAPPAAALRAPLLADGSALDFVPARSDAVGLPSDVVADSL